jgi:hypothetical protein
MIHEQFRLALHIYCVLCIDKTPLRILTSAGTNYEFNMRPETGHFLQGVILHTPNVV